MAGCRIFNGSSYYTGVASSAYNGLSGITISAWVYRPAGLTYTPIWSCVLSSSQAIGFYWWNDNLIYMDVRNGSVKYRAASSTATGWNHVIGIFDGTGADAARMGIVLNGVWQTTTGTTGNPSTTSNSLNSSVPVVGREPQASRNIDSGHALAHVSVYNVALSAAERLELMQKPHSAQRGRLHYWSLNNNDTAATHVEKDLNGSGNLTGVSMSSTSASMLSPRICAGGANQWL